LQDWVVRPILRTVPGVTDVNSFGGQVKQYQVLLDPGKLKSLNLTLRDVMEAVEKNNANSGAGYIEHREEQYIVRGLGLARGLDDLERIVVASRNGRRSISTTWRSTDRQRTAAGATTRDGKGEAVSGIVLMLYGASSKEVVAGVKGKVKTIQKLLPAGVRLVPYYDRTELVQKTIRTVRNNLLEGGLLVVAVLFYFLGNVRAALIVALVIPLSMLFSFLGMHWLKLSANLMTLGAIDFGMIVDGSVVLVENTIRNLAERSKGESLNHTIFESAREVARPIVFGIGIIVIVYLPIVTLRDMEGKMFSPMAYTVGFALLGSLILTVTVVPALCSLLLKGRIVEEKDPWLLRALREAYLPALRKVIAHPGKVLGVTGAALGLALALVPFLGSEFLPTLDEGSITVQSFRLPSVSVTDTVKTAAAVEKALLSFPEVKSVISRAGRAEIANDPMGIDVSDIFVDLKPRGNGRRPAPRRNWWTKCGSGWKTSPACPSPSPAHRCASTSWSPA
jgi:cobalt-zinc-cadmium resistance protein CzcA